MEDEELIKEIPKTEEEGIINTLEKEEQINFKKIIIIGSIVSALLIIVIIILIILLNKGNNSSEDENQSFGIISCIYNIETTKSATKLISKDFIKTKGISLYIDGIKQESIIEYQFNNLGLSKVNFTIPENFDMKICLRIYQI